MKSSKYSLYALTTALCIVTSASATQYNMALHEETVVAHNGAVTTAPQAQINTDWNVAEKQVQEVADGIWRIAGWGIANVIAIEGHDGWLIIDTGDNIEYAKQQRAALEQQVGKEITVAGIFYTHSHYVWGTTVWMDENTKVYGHEDLVKHLMADNGINVLTGNFNTRAIAQFGMLHPKQGPDAFPSLLGFSAEKLSGEKGFVEPHITFKHNEVEEHVVSGLTVEVLPSQTDVLDSVAYYFPEKKLLVTNALGSASIFNLYTLRGDIYRDPMRLVDAAELALSRDIEVQVDIHGPASIGKNNVMANLQAFRDSMQLIHDQTYRAIALGKDAQEAAEFVYMPESLRKDKETYGQVESHVKAVYNGRIGWMGWDVYNINPLAKAEQAEKIVQAMGGVDAVTSLAKAANEQQEIAGWQWSLYLTSQLRDMGALSEDAKLIRSESARRLGQHTTSANARGWYISEALLHEKKLAFNDQIISDYRTLSQALGKITAEGLASSPLNANVNYLRFLVDPRLAGGKNVQFNAEFTDQAESYGIALRNGIIAVTERPNSGKTIQLTKTMWDAIILGTKTFASLDEDLSSIDTAIGR